MSMLKVDHLNIRYGDLEVVRDICFSVEEKQWLMIVGPNGAGKSTILNAISRGVPYKGSIQFQGKEIRTVRPFELARHIGILAQNHMVGYDFTVQEVVNLGRYAWKKRWLSGDHGENEAAVRAALEVTGLADMAHKSVLHMSGGEVQRTFLAQLFAQDPQLMILDEPANHLDLVYQKQIFELISAWLTQPGRAVISVVHDLSLAKAYGTQCLLLNRGEAVSFGSISNVLTSDHLRDVYEMDVYDWMRKMLGQWV